MAPEQCSGPPGHANSGVRPSCQSCYATPGNQAQQGPSVHGSQADGSYQGRQWMMHLVTLKSPVSLLISPERKAKRLQMEITLLPTPQPHYVNKLTIVIQFKYLLSQRDHNNAFGWEGSK